VPTAELKWAPNWYRKGRKMLCQVGGLQEKMREKVRNFLERRCGGCPVKNIEVQNIESLQVTRKYQMSKKKVISSSEKEIVFFYLYCVIKIW
jgi:hypothetical protein